MGMDVKKLKSRRVFPIANQTHDADFPQPLLGWNSFQKFIVGAILRKGESQIYHKWNPEEIPCPKSQQYYYCCASWSPAALAQAAVHAE